MSQEYGRKFSFIIAKSDGSGLDFASFRIVFQIRRGDYQSPNALDARIYNLNDATANVIFPVKSEFMTVTVKGGYEGNYGQIFYGTIRQVRRGRENQKDSYIDVTAADGDAAYNFAAISDSVASQTPGGTAVVLLNAMKRFGISQGYAPNWGTAQSPRGRVYYGSVKDELRDFAQSADVLWSIQDGKLVFVPQTSYIPGTPILLSVNTGLIGTPEQTQNGISVRLLLNSSIKIGTLVKLDATVNLYRYGLDLEAAKNNPAIAKQNKVQPDGLYYVMNCEHNGDTRGTPWYTELTCLAIDSTLVNTDQANALFAINGPDGPIHRN